MAWLSIRELSEKLKVSQRTVRRMNQREALTSRLDKGLRYVLWQDEPEDNASGDSGGADDDSLQLLFDVFEDLRALRFLCLEEAASAKSIQPVLDEISVGEPPPTFERWKSLFQKLNQYVRTLEPLVCKMSLDPKVFLEIYVGMLDVRERWNYYARSCMEPMELQGNTVGPRLPKELLGNNVMWISSSF